MTTSGFHECRRGNRCPGQPFSARTSGVCSFTPSDRVMNRDASRFAYGPFHDEGQRDGCKVVLDRATDGTRTPCRKPQASRSWFTSRTIDANIAQRERTSNPSRRHSSSPRRHASWRPWRHSGWYGVCGLDQPYDDSPASTNAACGLDPQRGDDPIRSPRGRKRKA
jgi:hypothetical protein